MSEKKTKKLDPRVERLLKLILEAQRAQQPKTSKA
jgi:hypothetical protein